MDLFFTSYVWKERHTEDLEDQTSWFLTLLWGLQLTTFANAIRQAGRVIGDRMKYIG